MISQESRMPERRTFEQLEAARQRQRTARHDVEQGQRATGGGLSEIEISRLMPVRRDPFVALVHAGRDAANVPYLGGRQAMNRKSSALDAVAKLHLLPIKEEVLVECSDGTEHVRPHHERCTRDPVYRPRLLHFAHGDPMLFEEAGNGAESER